MHNDALEIIPELQSVDPYGSISDPDRLFQIGTLSDSSAKRINSSDIRVFITKKAAKHIFDKRIDIDVLYKIPDIIKNPTKIVDNSKKRSNSFLFAKMNGKAKIVVLEITKTPGECQVVSAFPTSKNYYRKLIDISGRTAVPPFATPTDGEESS